MDHKISKDMISSGMIPSGEKTQADLGRTQYGSAPSPSSLMEAYRSIYEQHQKDADGKVIEHGEKEELNEGKMPEGLKNYLMKKGKKKDDKDMKEERVRGGGVSSSMPKIKEKQKVIDKLTGYQQTQKGVGAASLIPDSSFSNPNPRRTTRNEMYGGSSSTNTTPKPNPTTPAKKPGLIQRLKNRTAATNAAINQMNDVDLFDLVKGRLIDEGCDEQEAIKIMVNISEEELQQIVEMDRMGGPAAIAGILGAGVLGAKKVIDGVKGMKDKLQQKTKEKNKMMQGM